ncbi:MAG: glycosyltransferase [Acidiferrobacterales bacterium]|nr:glycosyltransferase [Acidiferrobacterales bacterium]
MDSSQPKYQEISLSVVIPSYNRGAVLVDTLELLLSQTVLADEIIIVDQTRYSEGDKTALRLGEMNEAKRIRWITSEQPSIPKAMNRGLVAAQSNWVLFLDDDVQFGEDFIKRHKDELVNSDHLAHVGQVVQPWQSANTKLGNYQRAQGIYADLDFVFNSDESKDIVNCMAGNLCVNRSAAIAVGGFDENFDGVAYRFETEFSRRFCKFHQCEFKYFPRPALDHLHVAKGGTREHAQFLTSPKPFHSMGDYYYALRVGSGSEMFFYIARRMLTCLWAKFYLIKPWFMPIRLIAECRGFISAWSSYRRGAVLLTLEVESYRGE